MKNKVVRWMGRPIEDLSKEELIEVINHLSNNIRRQQERHIKQLEKIFG